MHSLTWINLSHRAYFWCLWALHRCWNLVVALHRWCHQFTIQRDGVVQNHRRLDSSTHARGFIKYLYVLIWNLRYMAASKQANIHMYMRNAVPLVWGSLRLTPIIIMLVWFLGPIQLSVTYSAGRAWEQGYNCVVHTQELFCMTSPLWCVFSCIACLMQVYTWQDCVYKLNTLYCFREGDRHVLLNQQGYPEKREMRNVWMNRPEQRS